MIRTVVRVALCAVVVGGLASAQADEMGPAIDLASVGEVSSESSIDHGGIPFSDVAQRLRGSPRQFYISGMIGPSFAGVTSPSDSTLASSDTLFNAGGAIGIAFERRNGRLRIETEGMGRSTYDAPFLATPTPGDTTILTNNWSVMENMWRDFMLTERFGIYGGGGIGAGGYILGEQLEGDKEYADPGASFAWQFGGGLLWEISNRLTFDVGYRYFHIDTITQPGVEPNQFSASELMFTLRLYEPFRNWRR
jgi:opacity protein-like surface antigen